MAAWRDAFVRLQKRGRVVFTATVHGSIYAKHGTTVETRLTVIDKIPADDPLSFPASPGTAPDIATLENELSESLGAKVSIQNGRGNKGKLVIHYANLDALDGVLERLRNRS